MPTPAPATPAGGSPTAPAAIDPQMFQLFTASLIQALQAMSQPQPQPQAPVPALAAPAPEPGPEPPPVEPEEADAGVANAPGNDNEPDDDFDPSDEEVDNYCKERYQAMSAPSGTNSFVPQSIAGNGQQQQPQQYQRSRVPATDPVGDCAQLREQVAQYAKRDVVRDKQMAQYEARIQELEDENRINRAVNDIDKLVAAGYVIPDDNARADIAERLVEAHAGGGIDRYQKELDFYQRTLPKVDDTEDEPIDTSDDVARYSRGSGGSKSAADPDWLPPEDARKVARYCAATGEPYEKAVVALRKGDIV